MAKGAFSKDIITNKILEVFEGSFVVNGKEIRIPMIENNEQIEIKIALTCAKDVIGGETQNAISVSTQSPTSAPAEVTEEEKKEVQNLMEKLGL